MDVPRFETDVEAEVLAATLAAKGCAVIERLAPESTMDAIADELAPWMSATPYGPDDFSASATRRTGGLLARSATGRRPVMHPSSTIMVPPRSGRSSKDQVAESRRERSKRSGTVRNEKEEPRVAVTISQTGVHRARPDRFRPRNRAPTAPGACPGSQSAASTSELISEVRV